MVEAYERAGYWGRTTLSDVVAGNASSSGGRAAFVSEYGRVKWGQYDEAADVIAGALHQAGVRCDDKVGLWLRDGATVHAAMLGVERAGAVAVGIGARAGEREAGYLLSSSGARALITSREMAGAPAGGLIESPGRIRAGVEVHLTVTRLEEGPPELELDGHRMTVSHATSARSAGRGELGPNDLFFINSTSGTTGLPKKVMQFQNRWFYYHQLVGRAIDLEPGDVYMSLLPAPFGFGLWTSHFTPALAAAPVVVMERFTAEGAIELLERERVTILCCVSTQFIMLLNSPRMAGADLSSLRAIFTGGEAVPFHRAEEFEKRTGAKVLQFYGSNETGAFSHTSASDSAEVRLTTCGHVIEEMAPRLYENGVDVTSTGGPGQPACRGPATCAGYYRDDEGNSRLYTPDGWMLMEDIATVDAEGLVRLTGRKGDFIIRGGKNISAAAVEDAVGIHPGVAMVAAVPIPDDVFGERVGVFVVPRDGPVPSVADLARHLTELGCSKEMFPEHVFVVEDLPRSSGGKVAKGLLRQEVAHFKGR